MELGFFWVPPHAGVNGSKVADGAANANTALKREVDVEITAGVQESNYWKNITSRVVGALGKQNKLGYYFSIHKSVKREQSCLGTG